jgi:hypothetical protein
MIRVILESSAGELAVVGRQGNEAILCRSRESHFPLLSQVDTSSYAVFSRADMPQLLSELNAVSPEAEDHIREVIMLAHRCSAELDTVLTFTPFA